MTNIIDETSNIRVIEPSFEYLEEINGYQILKKLERCIRTCYKSENNISDDSANRMIEMVIKSGHTSTLEHVNLSVKFITDRGVTHELVRHRHCGFSQESTRYCAYEKDKFGNKLTVVKPILLQRDSTQYGYWKSCMDVIAKQYFDFKKIFDVKNDLARGLLPNDLKTEICVTASLREWRSIFELRCDKAAHPSIRYLMTELLSDLHTKIPVVFDDLYEKYLGNSSYQNGS